MTRGTAQLDEGHIEGANAATLRRLWATSRGIEPPKTFTARLMRLALAWDAQAASAGCEAAKVRRDWNRVIKGRAEGGSIKRIRNAPSPSVGIGTRLLKDWGGATHEVLVVEGGASWKPVQPTSLARNTKAGRS